jgi:hypothetical protein
MPLKLLMAKGFGFVQQALVKRMGKPRVSQRCGRKDVAPRKRSEKFTTPKHLIRLTCEFFDKSDRYGIHDSLGLPQPPSLITLKLPNSTAQTSGAYQVTRL